MAWRCICHKLKDWILILNTNRANWHTCMACIDKAEYLLSCFLWDQIWVGSPVTEVCFLPCTFYLILGLNAPNHEHRYAYMKVLPDRKISRFNTFQYLPLLRLPEIRRSRRSRSRRSRSPLQSVVLRAEFLQHKYKLDDVVKVKTS